MVKDGFENLIMTSPKRVSSRLKHATFVVGAKYVFQTFSAVATHSWPPSYSYINCQKSLNLGYDGPESLRF